MADLRQQLSGGSPREALPSGTVLGGRYELVRPVAAGGFGAVYEARHVHTSQRVAVKVLHAWLANDPDTRERFRRELQAPAEIGHPGIVDIVDADIDEGTPFLVMEWLEGETLRARMRRAGTLSLTELRDLFDPFLDALAAAHAAGFVHRDLKPENCILQRGSDGEERLRLVDFGLARKTGARSVTISGTSLGTPRYMSPEQFIDAKTVGPAADVWAVGAMMYEALVGEPPFAAKSAQALLLAILTREHVPITARLPGCPSRLAQAIEQCLRKEPAERPRDASALRSQFLGAYAAISGGVALRTIPEMRASTREDHAPPPDRSEQATAVPGRRSPAAPIPPTRDPEPPPPRITPRPASAPSTSRTPALLIAAIGVVVLGLVGTFAVVAWLVLSPTREDPEPRPLEIPRVPDLEPLLPRDERAPMQPLEP